MSQLKLSKNFLKASSSQAEKDLGYKRVQDGAQGVLVEHQAPEQGKLEPNQPRQADEHGPACTSQGKHVQGYLQRLLYQHRVPENTLETNNLFSLLILLIVL